MDDHTAEFFQDATSVVGDLVGQVSSPHRHFGNELARLSNQWPLPSGATDPTDEQRLSFVRHVAEIQGHACKLLDLVLGMAITHGASRSTLVDLAGLRDMSLIIPTSCTALTSAIAAPVNAPKEENALTRYPQTISALPTITLDDSSACRVNNRALLSADQFALALLAQMNRHTRFAYDWRESGAHGSIRSQTKVVRVAAHDLFEDAATVMGDALAEEAAEFAAGEAGSSTSCWSYIGHFPDTQDEELAERLLFLFELSLLRPLGV